MKGVSVKVVFKRNIFSHFMTVYVPTVLIILVSYLTTFFNNQKWFGHIITINLTVSISEAPIMAIITRKQQACRVRYFGGISMFTCKRLKTRKLFIRSVCGW